MMACELLTGANIVYPSQPPNPINDILNLEPTPERNSNWVLAFPQPLSSSTVCAKAAIHFNAALENHKSLRWRVDLT